jgi:hypothetical protein
VRLFADLADHSDASASGIGNKTGAQSREFFDAAWARCEKFLSLAQKAYLGRIGTDAVQPACPGLLRTAFRERLTAAMQIHAVEALFPAPWTAAARCVLPSPSPQLNATALWGHVLGWCALELLAESIDVANPERIALDLFDRLRLREPFSQAFNALGFEGEKGWRVAARIKVLLLTEAGAGKPEDSPVVAVAEEPAEELSSVSGVSRHDFERTGCVAKATGALQAEEKPSECVSNSSFVSGNDFSRAESATKLAGPLGPAVLWPALWSDPDVRWLTGVHEAEGHSYLVREQYEELLWWLQMPFLLRLAGEAVPSPVALTAMSCAVEDSLAIAEAAGYRVDLLSGSSMTEAASDAAVLEAKPMAESVSEPVAASVEEPSFAEKPEPAEQGSEPPAVAGADPV